MAFVVVYDACVLYPRRSETYSCGWRELVCSGRWTERILDECFRNIVAARPDLEGKLDRTRRLMAEAIPDALVSGYEGLARTVDLPDEDDRHVLAAAIRVTRARCTVQTPGVAP